MARSELGHPAAGMSSGARATDTPTADAPDTYTTQIVATTGLTAYALALVLAAIATMALAAIGYPILPTIAIGGEPQPSGIAIAAGVAFWILFGFAGTVRPRGILGGGVVTFHMPFVVAGTILGGPVVGALMGVISVTEVREIRRAPWYGLLANHAVCVLAAVSAGVAGEVVRTVIGRILPPDDPLHTLAVGAVVAATFVTVNHLLVLPVVALRARAELWTIVRSATSTLRTTIVAEVALGWLMAVTYLSLAWWAPLVCVLVILAVWDAHDRREALRRDPMTGLLNDAGFQPLLEAALEESRRQGRRHALCFVDLDGFGQLNKDFGGDVGDDVIRAVAARMAGSVRGTDVVGRQNRAGDEFIILFRDLPDDLTAVRLAARFHHTIVQPVRVRGDSLEVRVGASIGVALLSPGILDPIEVIARTADRRMQAIKKAGGGVLGPDDERTSVASSMSD